jgi:MFS family permease
VVGISVATSALLGGWLADRVGRRPVMIVPRLLLTLAAYPAFLLLTRAPGAATLLGLSALLAVLGTLSSTASLVAMVEMLPRSVRSAGLSVVWAFTVLVFGGTTQFVVTWLIGVTGDPLAPGYYLMATGLLGIAAMLAMSETKGAALVE